MESDIIEDDGALSETAVPVSGRPTDAMRDQDWASLIGRVAEGDQQALAALYDTTKRLIFGLIVRILRDASASEEILLDVYTQVWRQAALYDPERGAALSWLLVIARSRALNRLRSESAAVERREDIETAAEFQSRESNPEDALVFSERRRLVRSALDALSPEQREVIELAYYAGLSHSEIAARLNQPLGTVKTRTRLGMVKLRRMLEPLLEKH
ncbi:MAG: sigma-70 family RNA polymerase sigma factor [Acidobacteriota bacterium]